MTSLIPLLKNLDTGSKTHIRNILGIMLCGMPAFFLQEVVADGEAKFVTAAVNSDVYGLTKSDYKKIYAKIVKQVRSGV